jgi:large subunit ribosomal protein L24
MKIRTGDLVLVIAGKDRGKTGKVIRVLPEKQHVIVEGLNLRMKYIRKTEQQAGQKITFEASMPSAKVMALDPKTKKPTRLGFKIDAKTGKKERIARASGTVIPKAADAKPEKKAARTVVEKKKVEEAVAEEKGTAKKGGPFWKRMGFGKAGPAADQESHHKSAEPDHPVQAQQHKAQSRGS